MYALVWATMQLWAPVAPIDATCPADGGLCWRWYRVIRLCTPHPVDHRRSPRRWRANIPSLVLVATRCTCDQAKLGNRDAKPKCTARSLPHFSSVIAHKASPTCEGTPRVSSATRSQVRMDAPTACLRSGPGTAKRCWFKTTDMASFRFSTMRRVQRSAFRLRSLASSRKEQMPSSTTRAWLCSFGSVSSSAMTRLSGTFMSAAERDTCLGR